MSQPFIGEIRMFCGNFAPLGWALCDGQLLPISENDALFALLGTNFGGDGQTTFALPDLRGRLALHAGSGPGLTLRRLADKGGVESVSLTVAELPLHDHAMIGTATPAAASSPANRVFAVAEDDLYSSGGGPLADGGAGDAIALTGQSVGHTNMMPFCCVNFIIALFGIFPSQG